MMLRIDFLSLFPEVVLEACRHSILARAEEKGIVEFGAVNPRDFTYDRHGKVDDAPYGGAAGMLMAIEPVHLALDYIGAADRDQEGLAVVMTDPTGRLFSQADARALSHKDRVVFLCGHYEGFDDRVRELFATDVFSIGDYVLTGGELPAMVMADAIVRLLPGSLGSEVSLAQDSFSDGMLSAPNYTRPESYLGKTVPPVLLSGDHGRIAAWRAQRSLELTKERRPDLLSRDKVESPSDDMLSS